MKILSLAMPVPLRQNFDYLPPVDLPASTLATLQPGVRVRAPFGATKLVGILLAVKTCTDVPADKLKTATAILDQQPLLPPTLLALGQWAANYYHHPIGDVLSHSLPSLLRKGKQLPSIQTNNHCWQLSTAGKGLPQQALRRAPKQAQLLQILQRQATITTDQLVEHQLNRQVVNALLKKGLIEIADQQAACRNVEAMLTLNSEQQHAVDTIKQSTGYHCFLLEGITGSGKTEVYLQLIDYHLARDQQALVLIPEIGLTPQMLTRFQRRFTCPIALLHSGLSDSERLLAWQLAGAGEAGIIIGTRSALFTPLPRLGLIIVDEEHDVSFKQQSGFRYSARDMAIKRAFDERCPIVLGSATPSLETLQRALDGRYQHLHLTQRAAGASQPSLQLLDVRHTPLEHGFSSPLLQAIDETLQQGNQVLVFINRRGFAPILLCQSCGYIARCDHCDASLTVHFQQALLRCHHCENRQILPKHCPICRSSQLDFRGMGTERSERALRQFFPATSVIRIDSDTTVRKRALQDLLKQVNDGQPCILVGTQMLAKGHHFRDVTLVAIMDIDGGLFSADFRGSERMGQLLVQVAGRAGRESKSGKVIIQTCQADHPLMTKLINTSYRDYATELLALRRHSGLPPFSYLALLRAEAAKLENAEQLLQNLRGQLPALAGLHVFGPLPAPMTRRAGRYRAQLLLQANRRHILHQALDALPAQGKAATWVVDVDPIDAF